MSIKQIKMGGILIICFLFLNFGPVVAVMNRTSKLSSSSSSRNFSAWKNQTHGTGEIVDQLKFELDGIEKWRNSTEEKLESHQIQIQALSNQTKIDEKMEGFENDNRKLKKSHEELKEQFESLSQKIDQLQNNVSTNQNISFLVSPKSTEPPAENEDPQSLKSCSDAMEILPSPRSQKKSIYPHGNSTSLEVLCDFETDGGGWTIIQRRRSGPKEEFNRNWDDYKNGFGSLDKNFWIGLENIHALTQNGDQELRIQLEDFEGGKRYAKYRTFSISDASDCYRLSIDGFSGTAGDSMNYHNKMRFSTKDKDHDAWNAGNCAEWFSAGGFWFNDCYTAALNGLYFEKGETVSGSGIYWSKWKGSRYSLAKTEMKIRPRT